MQVRALVTLALALVLAGVSVALAHAWLTAAARPSAPSHDTATAQPGPATVPLVVAGRALSYGDKLRPADAKLVAWPKSAVPPGALHALDRLIASPAPVVLRPIEANEPILTGKITGFGSPARLAATVGPGMRAAIVKLGGPPGLAGSIGPGDRVDVLIAREVSREARERELRAAVLLYDVRVLGLDPDAGGPSASTAPTRAVTLEVSVEQAQKLAVAHKIGTLSLALRGLDRGERGNGTAGLSRAISSRDLPAGLERGAGFKSQAALSLAKPSALSDVRALARKATDRLAPPARPAVRIFRGLEVSLYEVSREQAEVAIRAIDLAKVPRGAAPAGLEPSP